MNYLDIHLELNPVELYAHANPTRVVAELARDAAEEECMRRHVVLRHSEPVDVYSRAGVEKATGKTVLLVATRWVVDGRVS